MNPNDGIIFAVNVQNPSDYGVVKFNSKMQKEKIVEKPRSLFHHMLFLDYIFLTMLSK